MSEQQNVIVIAASTPGQAETLVESCEHWNSRVPIDRHGLESRKNRSLTYSQSVFGAVLAGDSKLQTALLSYPT